MSTQEGLSELEALVDGHLDTLEPVMVAIRGSLTIIGRNVEWMDIYERDMVEHFIVH